MMRRLNDWARALKRDVIALWLAARDPRVPWYAKAVAGTVAAYALSPIDLIPDFIPVLGYVDDLLIVPLGIAVAVRLVPAPVMADLRRRASDQRNPTSLAGLAAVVLTWLTLIALIAWLGWLSAVDNGQGVDESSPQKGARRSGPLPAERTTLP